MISIAKKKGWIVISMKHDWKRIFAFEQWRGHVMQIRFQVQLMFPK